MLLRLPSNGIFAWDGWAYPGKVVLLHRQLSPDCVILTEISDVFKAT